MQIPDKPTQKYGRRSLSLEERRQLHARTDIEETVATAEAAALLGNRPQTLRRWACQGDGADPSSASQRPAALVSSGDTRGF